MLPSNDAGKSEGLSKDMPISSLYKKWKSWNKGNKSQNKERFKAAAARRSNAGPASEAPSNVFSKKHVKKRHKKALTKAKRNYGEGSIDHLRATRSKRADSALKNATPSRSRRSEAQDPNREGGVGRRKARRKAHRNAAIRRANNKDYSVEKRTETGAYKGKYFGRDEFKGDRSKIKAWKAAGKPKTNGKVDSKYYS